MATQARVVACPYCGQCAILVSGSVLYPRFPELHAKWFWRCQPCGAHVGCHPGTKEPLGTLANAPLRQARQAAHAAFDPLWRDGGRSAAYRWLAGELQVAASACHIGQFDEDQCRRVVEAVRTRQGVDVAETTQVQTVAPPPPLLVELEQLAARFADEGLDAAAVRLRDVVEKSKGTEVEVWGVETPEHYVIPTAEDYAGRGQRLVLVRSYKKRVVEWFRGTKAQPGPLTLQYQAYQALLEREKQAIEPADLEDKRIVAALNAYDQQKEQERLAEQARLEAEERAREEARRAEVAQQGLDAALELAVAEVAAGDGQVQADPSLVDRIEEAAELAATPLQTPAVYVPSATPKVAGVSKPTKNWQVHPDIPVNVMALATAIVAKKHPVTFLLPNVPRLNDHAKSTEGTQPVAGVTFWNNQGRRTRGR